MKFNTYEEFIDWLNTDPKDELKQQAFDTIPTSWNMRFLRESFANREVQE